MMSCIFPYITTLRECVLMVSNLGFFFFLGRFHLMHETTSTEEDSLGQVKWPWGARGPGNKCHVKYHVMQYWECAFLIVQRPITRTNTYEFLPRNNFCFYGIYIQWTCTLQILSHSRSCCSRVVDGLLFHCLSPGFSGSHCSPSFQCNTPPVPQTQLV